MTDCNNAKQSKPNSSHNPKNIIMDYTIIIIIFFFLLYFFSLVKMTPLLSKLEVQT
jgi:hypothetical protein